MSTIPLDSLDLQELQQLAAGASAAGDQGAALVYLKEAAARADATAISHYVLGVEYAEMKLYEKAIGAIEAAVALAPSLSIARFQLGLLWLSSGNSQRAIDVLEVLGELGEDQYLHHFGRGLCHMARDEAEPALEALRTGIAMNSDNAPLNADMQRMVDALLALPAGAPVQENKVEPEQEANLMFLAAYTGNSAKH